MGAQVCLPPNYLPLRNPTDDLLLLANTGRHIPSLINVLSRAVLLVTVDLVSAFGSSGTWTGISKPTNPFVHIAATSLGVRARPLETTT